MTSRKVRRSRNRLANRIIVAGLVVGVLAALYALVGITRPVVVTSAARAAQAGRLTVSSAMVGCPAPGSAGTTGGGIAIANVPAGTGTGQVKLTTLDPGSADTPVSASPPPGQLTIEHVKAAPALAKHLASPTMMAGGLVPMTPARGGLIISATAANAQGLDVEQLGPGGQPTARCQPAGSDFWFVGPGSSSLHLYLYLMNTDSQPTNVAVSVQTDSGAWLGRQDSGIWIQPHSVVVQDVDKLVHGAKAIALHVTTNTGRVVAALRETSNQSKEGAWVPAAAEPATSEVLAGLPTSSGQRELYITVPGNAAAAVKVTSITPRGSYQPTGGGLPPLLGHETTGVSIPSLDGTSGAVKITSNVPVTATLVLSGGPSGAPGAFVVGSDAIIGQAVLAANTAGRIGTSDVVLAAPDGAATVSISQAVPGQALNAAGGTVVHIAAKSAVSVRLKVPKRSNASLVAIVVTPLSGSGPVYAGRIAVIGGAVQTVQSVVSSPARVVLSPVRESLLAVLGS